MLEAWFRDPTEKDSRFLRLTRDKLGSHIRESDEAPFGIVIVQALAPGSLRQIRGLADRARVIALLAPDARLSIEMKWSLLAAGTADVLDWPGEEQLAACIVPRLVRWAEIDVLIADDQVRSRVIGESPALRNLLRHVAEIAVFSRANLLLMGETGTGKEQIARLVHLLDRRPLRLNSSSWTAPPCRENSWVASCSGMSAAPSPAQLPRTTVPSPRRIAAPFFSTRSATLTSRCRRSCCV